MAGDPPEDLLRQATLGEPRALAELLELHLPVLHTYLRLHAGPLLRARESIADLAQSVCREALESGDRFEFRGLPPFRKWLFQKALSKVQGRHRFHRAARRDPAREQAAEPEGAAHPFDLPAAFCTPSQVAIAREDLGRLEVAFAQLGEEQREVITAARLLGESHAEIAARTGRSEGAVRVLLHRSLARLGRLMHAAGGSTAPRRSSEDSGESR